MLIPMTRYVDMVTPDNQPKVLHAGDQWQGPDHPHILLRDDSIRMMGSLEYGLTVDPNFGVFLQGPMSFAETPENIAIGAYWRMNPMLMASVGSMAAMPIPTLVPSEPRLLADKDDLQGIADGGDY